MSARIEEIGPTVFVKNDTQTVAEIVPEGKLIIVNFDDFGVALNRNEAAQLAVALQRVLLGTGKDSASV